jgi:Rieske Fe-S protein
MTDLAGHGSVRDSSGRIRQGPAMLDLAMPPHAPAAGTTI